MNNKTNLKQLNNQKAKVNNKATQDSYRLLAKGVRVSNNSIKTQKNNHDLIVGGSCAGKTGGYVTPNLLIADSSMVVVDTKGLLCKKYSNYLKKKGFRIVNIDFVNTENSDIYNMLDFVRRVHKEDGKVSYRQTDLKRIAKLLAPDEMDEKETFWVEAARAVIISLMAYALEAMEESEVNMVTVAKMYLLICADGGKSSNNGTISFFEELRSENPDSFAVAMYDTYKADFAAEKMWASIRQFVSIALEPFMYDELKQMFNGKSALNFSDLGREKTILFVNISDTDRSMYSVVNVFYQQMFQCLCNEADGREDGRLQVPVRIIMDDFASNFNIPDFDKIISVIRSRQIFVSLILQSISQLDGMYKASNAKTIINNCDFKVFFGGQDPETAKFIGDIAGCVPEKVTKMGADDVCILERGEEMKFAKKIPPYSMDAQMDV
ncbi:MAG: type IV secretory system conjugative DNA transfer family protein [Lachnospiraceae bacterium]|nr:type IV secretory system conjugative DNA transfer family protein [Lachnospiraceae bacterium]